ncbi:tRNA(Ile)-lysidine synthase [Nonlabens sp. Hel1_33_55]|uniref:tRNA lysidine(34) synthetase TilS n=1 Tax=Nonlabens sp. Hel1_33_55 TaxID=1336802 RepID=UPI000875EDB2|nr:tRNA lysidine(34) synthetase TilS [Nonlabens sp. Hel1_33_55]SCX93793.1 tRNA(Ile)-lysidine synthase [Nonlabens sp. Hel1_33_55]
MLQAFVDHIKVTFPQLFDGTHLLAISGGLDSVVLGNLLQYAGIKAQWAHCNFNLRGVESDGDEQFLIELAKTHDIKLHRSSFDTKAIANERGISTQMAARDLRYEWFEDLRSQNDLNSVLTAHHLDDQIETFLINLNRGAGLAGLQGIPAVNQHIIRPLLPFSRDQILEYAQEHELKWREDSSNASNSYQRNELRNQVLPLLHNALPDLKMNFAKTLSYLNDAGSIVDDAVARFRESVTTPNNTAFEIHIDEVKAFDGYSKYLFYLLHPYGFSQVEDVIQLLDAETGKQLKNDRYTLLKDRDLLRLEGNQDLLTATWYLLPETTAVKVDDAQLTIETVNPEDSITFLNSNLAKNVLLLDTSRLDYPLTLRVWQHGDKMEPYGMKGSQLVSDILINEKISRLEKERCFVLESGSKIIWLLGLRSSKHHAIKPQTREIKKITWST